MHLLVKCFGSFPLCNCACFIRNNWQTKVTYVTSKRILECRIVLSHLITLIVLKYIICIIIYIKVNQYCACFIMIKENDFTKVFVTILKSSFDSVAKLYWSRSCCFPQFRWSRPRLSEEEQVNPRIPLLTKLIKPLICKTHLN